MSLSALTAKGLYFDGLAHTTVHEWRETWKIKYTWAFSTWAFSRLLG